MDPKEREAIAYHEAGHAVLGSYHDFDLQQVTIRPDENALGSASHAWRAKLEDEGSDKQRSMFEDAAVIMLGGPVAEERFLGRREFVHAQQDYRDVMRFVQRYESDAEVCTAWIAYLEERARSLVWRHYRAWPEIKALAAALLKRETLSPEEVREILHAVDDDEDVLKRIYGEGS